MIADPAYALVIADELNIVLRYDYLPVEEVLEAVTARAEMKHVIITGRNAPQALIDAADLVTEMTEVKHPFRTQNVRAQKGIEF
jgi:cob(I)alamin adenosyltransferase